MADEQHDVEHPPPFGEIPAEFLDPEGEGELNDPALMLESSADMRAAWKDWFCGKGPGKFVDVQFFGRGIGGVPAPAADAYKALEAALKASGYPHGRSWSNVCRKIANSSNYSLHSYGIAIDIDAPQNPQSSGSPWSGRIQKHHVDAALSIKNTAGRTIWDWGGYWSTPDRMHFQLDQGPSAVAVDWDTVPGAEPIDLPGVSHRVTATSLNMRDAPSTSGDKVASLSSGTQVAAQSDAPRQSDGYEWIKVKAGYGGRIVEGWVATEYLEAVAGAPPKPKTTGSQDAAPAKKAARLERPTHTVTASSLNVRSRPTTDGDKVASIPEGAAVEVQSDPAQQADGYEWVKIKAADGGSIVDGWVAAEYLQAREGAKQPAPEKTEAPADDEVRLKAPTHRVDASGLNMRTEPKLDGELITELPDGTQVRVLSDSPQESDGYEWVEVRAAVGDALRKGWVASKYLKPLG